jgi:hypothetical protein
MPKFSSPTRWLSPELHTQKISWVIGQRCPTHWETRWYSEGSLCHDGIQKSIRGLRIHARAEKNSCLYVRCSIDHSIPSTVGLTSESQLIPRCTTTSETDVKDWSSPVVRQKVTESRHVHQLRYASHLQTSWHTEVNDSPGKYAVLCGRIKATALRKAVEGIHFSVRVDNLRDVDGSMSTDVDTWFNNSVMDLWRIYDGFFTLLGVSRRLV